MKKQCGCPGPLCGDMTYDQIFDEMKARYLAADQNERDLKRIHDKWRRLGAEIR